MYNHDVLWFKMRPIITQTCLWWWHQGPHSCATTMAPDNFYYAMERRCALVGLKVKVSVPFLRFSCGCCLLPLFFLVKLISIAMKGVMGFWQRTDQEREANWEYIFRWKEQALGHASNGGIQTLCDC